MKDLGEALYILGNGYHVAYKPIILPGISFIFIKIKFIHFNSSLIFAMKSMSICND